MTPLTMCPGTTAYMPPEALVTPPQYSNKLDCFSHGVLTIQIVTRQFPNPGDAQVTIRDARYPTGRVVVFVPESERRKKNIDLVDPNHPLLPLALHCLKDDDTERPSANELCGRLATLKGEQMYTAVWSSPGSRVCLYRHCRKNWQEPGPASVKTSNFFKRKMTNFKRKMTKFKRKMTYFSK